MTEIVRPARLEDLDQLCALLEHVDPGMITMPQTPEDMESRVVRSMAAFKRESAAPVHEAYFLVLETDGKIVGTSSIFTNLGSFRPFYNYRISRQSKTSPDTGVSVETQIMHLVNDYHGATELGTLYLLPAFRGGGRGRLLSFARLMLIAADPLRFGPKVIAEIRGWTNDDGVSPFWENVGRKFFQMDYAKADKLSIKDHRFISDLMPRYPIYVDLLADEAQSVIAKPHDNAGAAMAVLESQGFYYDNMIDIFDAGPCVEAHTESIDIVRSATRQTAHEWRYADELSRGLIASCDYTNFAVAAFQAHDDRADVLANLKVSKTDEVLAYAFNTPVKRKA